MSEIKISAGICRNFPHVYQVMQTFDRDGETGVIESCIVCQTLKTITTNIATGKVTKSYRYPVEPRNDDAA